MKKNQLLIIFSFALLLCSCGNRAAEKAAQEENSIYGKWELTSTAFDLAEYEASDCESKSVIEFNKNGTYKDISVSDSNDGTGCGYFNIGNSGNFEIKGNKLTTTIGEILTVPSYEKESIDSLQRHKGEESTQTFSLENDKLKIIREFEDFDGWHSSARTYKRTTKDFYKK